LELVVLPGVEREEVFQPVCPATDRNYQRFFQYSLYLAKWMHRRERVFQVEDSQAEWPGRMNCASLRVAGKMQLVVYCVVEALQVILLCGHLVALEEWEGVQFLQVGWDYHRKLVVSMSVCCWVV
jgi:hypothetical protein